jgi:hypothetical protein
MSYTKRGVLHVAKDIASKKYKGVKTPSEFKQIRLLENLLNADARYLFPDLFDDSVLSE